MNSQTINITAEKSKDVVLEEGILNRIVIDTKEALCLNMTAMKNTDVTAMIEILQADRINVEVTAEEGSSCTILYWNNADQSVTAEETYHIKRDAHCKCAYGELGNAEVFRKVSAKLEEEGAAAELRSAVLAPVLKKFVFECISEAAHTSGQMDHYGILLSGGQYEMEATGAIQKYARGSVSHQTTRILTFEDKQKAIVMPKLLIDENDVQASHAMTVGQIDENQLYYLQSRGLSLKEAMQLISLGYLLPIADLIKDEEISSQFRSIIEKKVNETCLTSII